MFDASTVNITKVLKIFGKGDKNFERDYGLENRTSKKVILYLKFVTSCLPVCQFASLPIGIVYWTDMG